MKKGDIMKQNPYVVLGIKENATKKEILEALKYNMQLFGGNDGNEKNEDGEYYQQFFLENAKMLLDTEKRKEIDEYLKQEREKKALTVCEPSEIIPTNNINNFTIKNQNEFFSYICNEIDNKELFKRNQDKEKTTIYRFSGNQQFLACFGEDGTFIFAYSSVFRGGIGLRELFTDSIIYHKGFIFLDDVSSKKLPWNKKRMMKIAGVKTVVIPASKIIPSFLINEKGGFRKSDLLLLQDLIRKSISDNPKIINGLFPKLMIKKLAVDFIKSIKNESSL